MNKATDPFEEFLRKKKVELLETKYREGESEEEQTDDFQPPSTNDPEVEARLQEEVDDFFTSGKSAGAQLFNKAGTGLSDDKVEEIRDALEDVFEEDEPKPQTEDQDQTFVDFFRQVRSEYDGEAPAAAELELVEEVEDTAAEIAPPPPHPTDLGAAVAEVSTDELVAVEVSEDRRLNLTDILTPPADETEMMQRVELLGRLVAKLAERVKLPENEIIEVLIKSSVEF